VPSITVGLVMNLKMLSMSMNRITIPAITRPVQTLTFEREDADAGAVNVAFKVDIVVLF
jgi:hypothetical protein